MRRTNDASAGIGVTWKGPRPPGWTAPLFRRWPDRCLRDASGCRVRQAGRRTGRSLRHPPGLATDGLAVPRGIPAIIDGRSG